MPSVASAGDDGGDYPAAGSGMSRSENRLGGEIGASRESFVGPDVRQGSL